MYKKKILTIAMMAVLVISMVLLAACEPNTPTGDDPVDPGDSPAVNEIVLNDEGTTFTGEGIALDGNNVVISAGGSYQISGSLSNGGVIVNAPDQAVELVLDNVSITNSQGSAILVQAASDALISLADGSVNDLSDGSDTDYDAVIYGVVSLTIDGGGTLNVTGNVEEGIASDANVVINNGIINITAPDDGINGSEDGISEVIINGGAITIVAGGDGIDSNGSITINGGTIMSFATTADASGGLDADGDITINGGTIIATGASNSQPTVDAQKYLSFRFGSQQAVDSTISIQRDGEELFSAVVKKEFQEVLFSAYGIADDVTYQIFINDELAMETDTASNTGGMAGGPGGDPGSFPNGAPPDGATPPGGATPPTPR